MRALITVAMGFLFVGCMNCSQYEWEGRYVRFAAGINRLHERGCPALSAGQAEVFLEKPDLVTKVSTLYEIVLEAAQKGAAPLGPKDWAAAVMDRVYDEFCRSTGQAMKESWRDDRDFCSASAWIYEEADHFKDDLYPHIGFHGFVFVERNAAIVSATHFMGWRRVGRSSNRALGEN